MTQLKILEYPNPRLRIRAEEVHEVDGEIRQLVADMLETMYAAPGIGLAATQVDVHRRVLVVDITEDKTEPLALINPVITARDGVEVMEEGCLSVPGFFEPVERADRVHVEALDQDGSPLQIDAEGLLAVCIQHEIDHLDGKLFVDYLSELKRQRIRKRLQKDRKQRGGEPAKPRQAVI